MDEEKLIKKINRSLEIESSKIQQFKKQLEKNSDYAFRWSDDAVKAAATIKVFDAVKRLLEGENQPLGEIKNLVMDQILQFAKYPQHSTSQMSNLVKQYEGQAWSEILEILEE